MSREIKFRGRIKSGEWVYGDLIHNCLVGSFIVETAIKQKNYCPDEVIPETVGQFTGKLDKNGKEIYEGDIVKSPEYDNQMVVEYEDINPSDDMTAPGIGFQFNTEPSEMEIIGNIHENPELIK